MEPTTHTFQANAHRALDDAGLQQALSRLSHQGFPIKRREAMARLPEFDALCDTARDIKDHVLDNLDFYLERFEARMTEAGGRVHWARDAAQARDIILDICRDAGARTVTKSKSMIGEEIAINEHLEAAGMLPVETDLGEYIIQLRHEPPSHIIAPAIHLSKAQVADTFRQSHRHLDRDRPLDEPRQILEEARTLMRRHFLDADVGLTGANMLIAETGSVVVVTNEGNADLTQSLPRVHIALASLEKVVPTLEDATTLLRVLARSATGQDMSVYTTFSTGPKRPDDIDGPEEFHLVLLDNGRSQMLAGEFRDMLRCIRCAACLNDCPIYEAVGGHAYGWVYSGPMGAVLMPNLLGLESTGQLPGASTLCGRCEQVCPVRIPLPAMLRRLRRRLFADRQVSVSSGLGRLAMGAWAFVARRPALYRPVMGLAVAVLGLMNRVGKNRGSFRRLPFAGGWTASRDLPAPQGGTFISQWAKGKGRKS